MKRSTMTSLSIAAALAAGFMLLGHGSVQPGSTSENGRVNTERTSVDGAGKAIIKQSIAGEYKTVDEQNQDAKPSALSRRSPARKLLEAADSSPTSLGIAAKTVEAFCWRYYAHLNNKRVAVSAKAAAWCSGIEKRLSASQLAAMSGKAAVDISPIQQAVADLMSQKPGPEAAAKARQLVRIADSPGDMASSADILKRLDPDLIFKGTALNEGDLRADTFTHFAGMASRCNRAGFGATSVATMLVCTWPGFTCAANDDFNTALARNFSPNDLRKIASVAQRLTGIKLGY